MRTPWSRDVLVFLKISHPGFFQSPGMTLHWFTGSHILQKLPAKVFPPLTTAPSQTTLLQSLPHHAAGFE